MLLTPTFSCRMIVITKGGGRQDCFGIRPLRSPLFYLIFNSALCIFDKFSDQFLDLFFIFSIESFFKLLKPSKKIS